MLDQWEQFEAGPNEPADERLYVSLNGKGQMLLNSKGGREPGNARGGEAIFSARFRRRSGSGPLARRKRARSR